VLLNILAKKDISHSPPGKIVFCLSTSPADWQITEEQLFGIIQQFQNEFSSWLEDFHKRAD
jgi:hypothetical protein